MASAAPVHHHRRAGRHHRRTERHHRRAGRHHRRVGRIGATPASAAVLAAVAVWAVGIVVLLGAILLLAPVVIDVVGGRHLGGWDLEMSRSFADLRGDPLDDMTFVVSHAAGQYFVPIGTVVAAIALLLARQWRWAALVVIALATEGLLYLASTFVIERERPAVGQLDSLIHDDSYYSGHAAASVVIAGLVVMLVTERTTRPWPRALAWAGAALYVGLVGFSRIERGMHYASDVVVGMLVGIGCLLLARMAVQVAERRSRDVSP